MPRSCAADRPARGRRATTTERITALLRSYKRSGVGALVSVRADENGLGALTLQQCKVMADDWTDMIWEQRKGFAVVGVGVEPRMIEGKYKYRSFRSQYFEWPDDRQELLSTCVAVAGSPADVFVSPLLRDRPSRSQDASAPLPGSWGWIDADPWTDEQQALLDAFDTRVVTVHSGGRPENRHLYVELDREYQGQQVAAISAAMTTYFGTDTHGGDNKFLRLPGTLNHKPAVRDGLEPVRVLMLPW